MVTLAFFLLLNAAHSINIARYKQVSELRSKTDDKTFYLEKVADDLGSNRKSLGFCWL